MNRSSHIASIVCATVLLGAICTTQLDIHAEAIMTAKNSGEELKKKSLCSSNSDNKERIEVSLLNYNFTWIHCKEDSI
ncbi:MAG: hypothetical protein K6L75_14715 [Cellvibrionaceae bacterium]